LLARGNGSESSAGNAVEFGSVVVVDVDNPFDAPRNDVVFFEGADALL